VRGNPFAPLGLPSPLFDRVRPVFVEHGVDPTVDPGYDVAMGSLLRFGASYYEKTGPERTDWSLYPGGGSPDWYKSLRVQDAGASAFVGETTRIQFASMEYKGTGSIFTSTGAYGQAAVDQYLAVPEYFPEAGAIRRVVTFAFRNSLLVAGRMQLHIYSAGTCGHASFLGWPYPDQLLWTGTLWSPATQGSLISLPGIGNYAYENLVNIAVEAGTLLWFVLRGNDSFFAGSKFAILPTNMTNWMGFQIGSADPSSTGGCGWVHTHTFNNGADQTFPSSAPSVLTLTASVGMPALGFGFQQTL
jgi:hypothetical protein